MIRLSTKGRYAVRILIALAMDDSGKPVQKHRIADQEGISQDYVEQILVKLKTAGFVASHRGKKGGFTMAADPTKLTVAEVVESTEGPLSLVHCVGNDKCERESMCVTRPIWKRTTDAMRDVLSAVTIQSLADEAIQLRDAKSITFSI